MKRPTRADPAVDPEVGAGILDAMIGFARAELVAALVAGRLPESDLARALDALAIDVREDKITPAAREWLAARLDAAARSKAPREVPIVPPRKRGKRSTDDPDRMLGIALRVAGALKRATGSRRGPSTVREAIAAVARGEPVRIAIEGEPVRTIKPKPIPRALVNRAWREFGSTAQAMMRA